MNTIVKPILLGVNIDHVATLRQARGTRYPDPVQAALIAEEAGADGITVHMREDLRHIQARDVRLIKDVLQTRMNLELAVTDAMLGFAEEIVPEHVCFVPEKREEVTTEGGLDLVGSTIDLKQAVERMHRIGAEVSLFIDPNIQQIEAASKLGAAAIEIHTGCYADATDAAQQAHELARIQDAVTYALGLGFIVNAGHGLHYHNVQAIAAIPGINELNIGHAIIARAIFTGLGPAVKQMHDLMIESRAY